MTGAGQHEVFFILDSTSDKLKVVSEVVNRVFHSNSDVEALERYYTNICLIQNGKKRIVADFSEALRLQSGEYEKILREISETAAKIQCRNDSTEREQLDKILREQEQACQLFYNETRVFISGVSKDMLSIGFNCFESIRGKSAYQSLNKISYRK